MTPAHYIPVMKGKKGEYDALKELPASMKKGFTPLIEVGANLLDREKVARKTVDQHLEAIAGNLKESWGTERPVFIDGVFLSNLPATEDGSHPMLALSRQAAEQGIQITPVAGLHRDDEDYLDAVKAIAGSAGRLCLRASGTDAARPDGDFASALSVSLDRLGFAPSGTDLILDLADIKPDTEDYIAGSMKAAIASLPHAAEWRSLTLIGTSMPESFAKGLGYLPGKIFAVPRAEWELWQYLESTADELPRMPAFGDYTVVHPKLPLVSPQMLKMTAKIRYTAESYWLIVMGTLLTGGTYDQYFDLAKQLVDHPEFKGRDFSPGDSYIHQHAVRAKDATSGNPTTWIQAALSHHIAFVLHQLASSRGA